MLTKVDLVFEPCERDDEHEESEAPVKKSFKIQKLFGEWYVFHMTMFNHTYRCKHRTRRLARDCVKMGGCNS